MKAVLVGREARVCRLAPGEVKRFPFDGVLHGFYIACPACGYRNFVLTQGQAVSDAGGALSLAPGFWCDGLLCDRHLHIQRGEFVLTDAHA